MNLLILDRNSKDLSLREKAGLQAFLNALAGNEGTFPPTIIGSSTAGTQTYAANGQVGWYRAIGDIVYFTLRVEISAKDAAIAGNILVGGLPFMSKNITNRKGCCSLGRYRGVTFTAGYVQLVAQIDENTNFIGISQCGSAIAPLSLPVANIAASTQFNISGFYFI